LNNTCYTLTNVITLCDEGNNMAYSYQDPRTTIQRSLRAFIDDELNNPKKGKKVHFEKVIDVLSAFRDRRIDVDKLIRTEQNRKLLNLRATATKKLLQKLKKMRGLSVNYEHAGANMRRGLPEIAAGYLKFSIKGDGPAIYAEKLKRYDNLGRAGYVLTVDDAIELCQLSQAAGDKAWDKNKFVGFCNQAIAGIYDHGFVSLAKKTKSAAALYDSLYKSLTKRGLLVKKNLFFKNALLAIRDSFLKKSGLKMGYTSGAIGDLTGVKMHGEKTRHSGCFKGCGDVYSALYKTFLDEKIPKIKAQLNDGTLSRLNAESLCLSNYFLIQDAKDPELNRIVDGFVGKFMEDRADALKVEQEKRRVQEEREQAQEWVQEEREQAQFDKGRRKAMSRIESMRSTSVEKLTDLKWFIEEGESLLMNDLQEFGSEAEVNWLAKKCLDLCTEHMDMIKACKDTKLQAKAYNIAVQWGWLLDSSIKESSRKQAKLCSKILLAIFSHKKDVSLEEFIADKDSNPHGLSPLANEFDLRTVFQCLSKDDLKTLSADTLDKLSNSQRLIPGSFRSSEKSSECECYIKVIEAAHEKGSQHALAKLRDFYQKNTVIPQKMAKDGLEKLDEQEKIQRQRSRPAKKVESLNRHRDEESDNLMNDPSGSFGPHNKL